MEPAGGSARVPISLTHGCLVASIQVDLDEEILASFRRDLLEHIHGSSAAGVILDVSGVALMDAEDFEALRGCIAMAELMGARSVLVGLQPGVVSALVDMEVNTEGIEATLDLEEAFRLLQAHGLAVEVDDEPEGSPGESDPESKPAAQEDAS